MFPPSTSFGDEPNETQSQPQPRRQQKSSRFRHLATGLTLASALVLMVGGAAPAEKGHSNPWLLSWIPATCCVTNDCCWEISEREVRPLPGDQWEIRSTGQVRKRTDWSPDGKFYRCACDYSGGDGQWVKHQGANTRCLFVPLRSVSR